MQPREARTGVISISTNMAALRGAGALGTSTKALAQSFERLATGRRINRASDDPSGLIAAERLSAEQISIEKQLKALELESTRLAARDGAHQAVSDMLTELDGLVVSAANSAGLSDGERDAIQLQIDSVIKSLDHVAVTTTFNGQRVLEGVSSETLGRASLMVTGEDGTHQAMSYSLADLMSGGKLDLRSGRLEFAQAAVKSASGTITGTRAAIGARMQSNAGEARMLQTSLDEVSAAKSSIMDTDYAAETSKLMRAQVLQQAALYTTQLALHQNAGIVMNLLAGAKMN